MKTQVSLTNMSKGPIMHLKSVIKVDENGSLVSYEVQVDDVKLATNHGLSKMLFAGRIQLDLDGNYAQWDSGVPPELEVGGPLWDEFIQLLDKDPQVLADLEAYLLA